MRHCEVCKESGQTKAYGVLRTCNCTIEVDAVGFGGIVIERSSPRASDLDGWVVAVAAPDKESEPIEEQTQVVFVLRLALAAAENRLSIMEDADNG